MTTTSIKQTILARTARTLTSARRVAMMLLAVMMLTMTTQTAWAQQEVEIDGIKYCLDGNDPDNRIAMVIPKSDGYSGNIIIPPTVTVENNPEEVYNVTSIGDNAFSVCPNLASITIPASVQTIGMGAFRGCVHLSIVEFASESQLQSIDENAFVDCQSLTSITIPASVTSIGSSTFIGCVQLNTVDFESNSQLESIDVNAFGGCQDLASITIPASVTSIGIDAFKDCGQLNTVDFESNSQLESIGDNAFYNCSSLTSITIPNGVTSIGDNAFGGCQNLESIFIPTNVQTIGGGAFDNCESLESIDVEDGNPKFSSKDGVLFDKDMTTLIKYPKGKTGDTYFIPNTVTGLVNDALDEAQCTTIYYFNESLSESLSGEKFKHLGIITYEDDKVAVSGTSVEVEGNYYYLNGTVITLAPADNNYAFNSVPTVTCSEGEVDVNQATYTFTMPAYDVEIEQVELTRICGTFGYNDALTWSMSDIAPQDGTYETLTISGTGEMGSGHPWENAFKSSITTVIIEDGVTSIGASAFHEYTSLASVTFGENSQLTTIGDNAFYHCAISGITIPASVTSIGASAFHECTSLATITIPDGVTSIGASAFYNCTSLATITIPDGVTSVGSDAFGNTPWLNNQDNLEDGIVYVGKVAYKWKGDATSADIKDGTVAIAPWAFSCASITSVTIPTTVTNIGEYAFNASDLTSVTIPASVESIGDHAFISCTDLTTVYMQPTTPPTLGSDPFYGCNALSAIVVPAAAKSDYETGWSAYSTNLKAGYTVTCADDITATSTNNGPLVQKDETVALRWNGGLHLEAFGNRSGDARFTVTKSDATAVTVSYSYESDPDGVHYLGGGHSDASFTMPAGDVTVSARAYMPVPYIDASGNSAVRREDYTILTSESGGDDLPGGWYVAKGEFTIDNYLHFAENSDVHLILCDNAKITVNDSSNKVIKCSNLTIYGQTNGTGSLTCNATSDWAIEVDNLTICGGHVTATTTGCDAITLYGNINLYGGTLTATANDGTSNGIRLSGTLCLKGGTVESTGKIYATSGATITLASGKCYTDGTNIYTTSISSSDLEALGSVTLTPKKDFTLCTATVPDQTLGRFDPVTNSYFKTFKISYLFECPYLVGEEVTDGETILTHGTDYVFGTVTYASPDTRDYNTVYNDKTGDVCQVEIIGKGEYAGTKTVTFTIVDPSGTWGDKDELTWSLTNGALSIGLTHPENSNKAMKAADNYGKYPWANYCGDVTSITIGEGVTSIAPYAFGRHYDNQTESYSEVKAVTLPSTLTSIGDQAFKGCTSDDFKLLVIPAGVTSIGKDAFNGCTSVTDVYCYADPTKLTWDEDGCDDFITDSSNPNYKTKCHVADASAWTTKFNSTVNVTFVGDLVASSIPYIDADGNKQYCTDFTVLNSIEDITNALDEGKLPAGWYVVNSNIDYTSTLTLTGSGNVNLILCDGKTMNIGASNSVINENGIDADGSSAGLTIYGQTGSTGALNIYAKTSGIFNVATYAQYGGNVTVSSTDGTRVSTTGAFTIGGGTLNASSGEYNGIYASSTINLNGGTVIASGNTNGIRSYENIILAGATVTASSFRVGDHNNTISIADGKGYTDGTTAYTPATPSATLVALTNKTLKPITGVALVKSTGSDDITVVVNPSSKQEVSIPVPVVVRHVEVARTYEAHKASTVYLPFRIDVAKVTGGTFNMFTGVDESTTPWTVTYTEVTSGKIKANTPCIFLPDGSNGGKIVVDNGDETIEVGTGIAGDQQTAGEWEFIGTHSRIKWTTNTADPEYDATRADEIGTIYGFAANDSGTDHVGDFVKVSSGAYINPERAYLKRTTSLARAMTAGAQTQQLPETMRVVIVKANGETTEIGTLDTRTGAISLDEWYSLDGRRLSGKPNAKGVYIHNGKTVVIK